MARTALRRVVAAALTVVGLSGLPGAAAHAADPEALVRRMAAQPLRYGGILRGPVDGHVLIGLDAPGSDGALHGEAVLLGADRRLIEAGTVSGRVQPQSVPGGHDCTVDLAFDDRVTTLRGICSDAAVSGELLDRSTALPGWLARQIFWWDHSDSRGRAWLTEAAFYD